METIPRTPWLFPEEQPEVVLGLLERGLLKFDNKRSLPLKSGGTTDVYINLRDARDNPAAIKFVTELFAIPLRRLQSIGLKRFIEVPDSVSCFAGPLSLETNLPFLTIRGEAKEGRVSDAQIIGHPNRGEKVCILDDVITDGASKIAALQICDIQGLKNLGLVVLVDRQQGWYGKFLTNRISTHVWPGMTLHDVRRQLIQTLGVMKRCSAEAERKNPIIVALDNMDWSTILKIVDPLRTSGCIFKVNDLLFEQGMELISHLSVYGRVMADLKSHDIPNTIINTCNRLLPYKPWAVTIHGSGGRQMIKDAVTVMRPAGIKVLVVTVLTSLGKDGCQEIYHRLPLTQVLTIAKMAKEAGADGLVCSAEETRPLRQLYLAPEMLLVNPGIRSAGADAGDQKRISTPKAAIDNGADHLVMGRQIYGAQDPVAEVKRVLTEELKITL